MLNIGVYNRKKV